jgi:hypothetical protein
MSWVREGEAKRAHVCISLSVVPCSQAVPVPSAAGSSHRLSCPVCAGRGEDRVERYREEEGR